MGFDPHEPQQQRMLAAAMKSARINVGELWLKYFSLGGEVGEYEVEAYLQGLLSLPVLQRDLLAMAANELIDTFPTVAHPTPTSSAARMASLRGRNPGPGRRSCRSLIPGSRRRVASLRVEAYDGGRQLGVAFTSRVVPSRSAGRGAWYVTTRRPNT
ncbi:hypothetical protein AHiyo8_19840 [Arthrobacter sp. Hiyo8]|nr:hypothetical protein AHiyo8_19840 [Arthrobacter sp. Hiyo8]